MTAADPATPSTTPVADSEARPTSRWVRPPAVAGTFYPDEPRELAELVTDLVRAARPPGDLTTPGGLIVAHAGYRYSGPTAGAAYRTVVDRAADIRRIVVVGPAHRVPLAGIGTSSATAWETPLGRVPVDRDATEELMAAGLAVEADAAHAPEHSIETQLPFLQVVLGDVELVPLLVGRARTAQVAEALDALARPDTLLVASSDLSHYLDAPTARSRDAATATAIVEERIDEIGPRDACGCMAIRGLLVSGHRRGWVAQRLDLSTSADTSGGADRVVGYGAFALGPSRPLADDERRWLSALARRAVAHELATGETYPLADTVVPERLRPPGASFVTLEAGGRLLGCIGTLDARRPLWHDVAHNARAAAFDDPRFAPLTGDQLDGAHVAISVLSHLDEIPAGSRHDVEQAIRPGVDGLLLAAGARRGTFLPTVWAKLPEPARFVDQLVHKAGLPEDWPAGTRAWCYTTDELTDPPSS